MIRITYGISLLAIGVVTLGAPTFPSATAGRAARTRTSYNSMGSPSHTTQALPSYRTQNRQGQQQWSSLTSNGLQNIPAHTSNYQKPIQPSVISNSLQNIPVQTSNYQRSIQPSLASNGLQNIPAHTSNYQRPIQPPLASNSLQNIPAQTSNYQKSVQPSAQTNNNVGNLQAQAPSPINNNQTSSQSSSSPQVSNAQTPPSSQTSGDQGNVQTQQPAQLGDGQDTSFGISGSFSTTISWGDDAAASGTTTDSDMARSLSATLTFGDSQGNQPSNYHMTINWGDGTTTGETIGKNLTNKSIHITGTHIYHKTGTYVITLAIHDNNGSEITATRTVVV